MDPASEPAASQPAASQPAANSATHPAAPAAHPAPPAANSATHPAPPAAHPAPPARPAALRFPTTPRSRFDAALVRRHLREAAEFAQHCQRAGEPLLDPCGPRGDLYFLLKALLEQPQGRAHAAPVAGAEGLTV
jgi:hypothetical protein